MKKEKEDAPEIKHQQTNQKHTVSMKLQLLQESVSTEWYIIRMWHGLLELIWV